MASDSSRFRRSPDRERRDVTVTSLAGGDYSILMPTSPHYTTLLSRAIGAFLSIAPLHRGSPLISFDESHDVVGVGSDPSVILEKSGVISMLLHMDFAIQRSETPLLAAFERMQKGSGLAGI